MLTISPCPASSATMKKGKNNFSIEHLLAKSPNVTMQLSEIRSEANHLNNAVNDQIWNTTTTPICDLPERNCVNGRAQSSSFLSPDSSSSIYDNNDENNGSVDSDLATNGKIIMVMMH